MSPRYLTHAFVVASLLAVCFVCLVTSAKAGDETCEFYPADQWAPEGTKGCTLDGPTEGVASTWPGPVAAAQWCVWPWTDCTPVTVQSHVTGVTIVITPQQFCHCYWETDRRLIDLSPGQVAALGLDPAAGLFDVTVTPFREGLVEPVLPDTAVGR
jgi:hypothetical protein